MRQSPYSIHFGSEAWAEVGSLPMSDFDALMETIEYYAQRAASWLRAGGTPDVLEGVPILAGTVIAECTINDHERAVWVTGLARCERLRRSAGG